jgi:hypothetical protein
MHPSKPNVYQTLVLVGGIHAPALAPAGDYLRRIRGNIDRYLRPIGFPLLFWLNRNCEIAGSTAFPASRIEKSDE